MLNTFECHEEIYMMTVLNLKTARDQCPPLIIDPQKSYFKVGDMVLLKSHTLTTAHLILNIRLVIKSVNGYLTRHLTYKIALEKSGVHQYNSYNYYTQLIRH